MTDDVKPKLTRAPKGALCENLLPYGMVPIPCRAVADVRASYPNGLTVDYCFACWEALNGLDVHEDHRCDPEEDIFEEWEATEDDAFD